MNGALKTMKINVPVFALGTALAMALVSPLSMRAQNASEALYKAKCASCHGADGSGSPTGKELGTHDLQSADVQKMSDKELSDIITDGKNKMPGYGEPLKAEDIQGLVAYIRTLKK